MKWHELNEKDRINQVYSKFTIKQFWDWWSNNENLVMEIRIKDIPLLKEIAIKLKLQWSYSGVYVTNATELKSVIGLARDKCKLWFGLNPRKINHNKYGSKGYNSGPKGGSCDANVDHILFLPIDIDRINKNGSALLQDLKDADILANGIIDRMSVAGYNNNFLKICSGNGIQLLFKLDYPIKLPNVIYDSNNKMFYYNEKFMVYRQLLKKGIGKQIKTFASSFSKKMNIKLNVEIDDSFFALSKVGALPFTKNFKFDSYTWRGIIELKKGVNIGLTDYALLHQQDSKQFKKTNVFKQSSVLEIDHMLKINHLIKHKLVRFMLDNNLPYGQINNTLWMQLKCLVRDCNIDTNSAEFIELHKKLETKFKGQLTLNPPAKEFKFNVSVINNYCINNLIPPLYDVFPYKTKYTNYNLKELNMSYINEYNKYELTDKDNIFKDLDLVKKDLIPETFNNLDTMGDFLNSCVSKYGQEKTEYYLKYVMVKYLEYS